MKYLDKMIKRSEGSEGEIRQDNEKQDNEKQVT